MEIKSLISKAELSYYKLIIIVGKSGSGKTSLLRRISEELHFPLINLGLELSRRLLSLTNKQRKLMAAGIIEEILDEQNVPILVIDNTEVIFDPNLKLNPSGLLKNISRNRQKSGNFGSQNSQPGWRSAGLSRVKPLSRNSRTSTFVSSRSRRSYSSRTSMP